ncbi:MAG: CoA-binding protein [Gemmataceae bacterium]
MPDGNIQQFLDADTFAVVGASTDRSKYGNKVLRAYQQTQREVFPINPNADKIEGVKAYPNLKSVPKPIQSVSIITPPPITENAIDDIIAEGILNVWMQPGAESTAAIRKAEEAGLNVIAGGPCLLVVAGYREVS